MSHLRAAQVAKRAKVLEYAAAARAANTAARCASQETLKSVLRDMPELRTCKHAVEFFTYGDMAEAGMAHYTPGYRKCGAAYEEAKAAAAAAAVEHDLGHGYVDESLLVEQLQAMVGGACPHCSKRATITYVGSSVCGVGSKFYGRNSLWGYGALYGIYTGKVVFLRGTARGGRSVHVRRVFRVLVFLELPLVFCLNAKPRGALSCHAPRAPQGNTRTRDRSPAK